MFQYQCLNPISKVGLDGFTNDYIKNRRNRKSRCDPGKKCFDA